MSSKLLFQYLERFRIAHYFPQFCKKGFTLDHITTTSKNDIIPHVHLSSKQDRNVILQMIETVQTEQGEGIVMGEKSHDNEESPNIDLDSPEIEEKEEEEINEEPEDPIVDDEEDVDMPDKQDVFDVVEEPPQSSPPLSIEEDEDIDEDIVEETDERLLDDDQPVQPPPRFNQPKRGKRSQSSKPKYGLKRKGSKRKMKTKICVALRKRPMNRAEKDRKEIDIIECVDQNTCSIHEPKQKVDLTRYVQTSDFFFDVVFNEHSSTQQVYEGTTKPLIDHIFNKGTGTCFAYGQTGAGKTYTMMGGGESSPGIYLLASLDIFRRIATQPKPYEVWLSFFEIYGGKLFDLLNGKKRLITREDGKKVINIIGLHQHRCINVKELIQVIEFGSGERQTGCTGANDESSRSHAILNIQLRKPNSNKVQGKISFIDLAGSERGADTYFNDKQTRLEGAEINKSLLALKECIRSLDQQHSHVPFRGSKLTEVLRDSFIGNSRTVMIGAISPNSGSCEHTLNTLRYAYRVKELKNSGRNKGSKRAKIYFPGVSDMSHVRKKNYRKKKKKREIRKRKQPQSQPQPQPQHRKMEDENVGMNNNNNNNKEKRYEPPKKKVPNIREMGMGKHGIDGDGENLERAHEELINRILEEEEEVISSHRAHIDEVMDYVKQEMRLLQEVEKPGSAIDEYVSSLDLLLVRKIQTISNLRGRLARFQQHLREEEILSKSFQGQN